MGNPLHLTRQHPTAPDPLCDSSQPTRGVNRPYPSPHSNHQPTAAPGVHTSAPGGSQVRPITAKQLRLHRPHAWLQATLKQKLSPPTSCSSTNHTPAPVPLTPHRVTCASITPGGFPSGLRRGSVAPLVHAALRIQRWKTQCAGTGCRTVIRYPASNRERKRAVSRVNQTLHKHTKNSVLRGILLQLAHNSSIDPSVHQPCYMVVWLPQPPTLDSTMSGAA